jgi:Zn-finger nucleic acid-binding protein
MNCPTCNTSLTMTERNGVEIDYCPKCRGVWLDRGELDKIIERSTSFDGRTDGYSRTPGYEQQGRSPESYDYDDDRKYTDDRYDPRRKKRKSFLGDLFDFD